MQVTMAKPPLDLGDRLARVVGIGKVDLDVVLGAGLPRALLGERMARAGDHPPAGAGEADDGRMPDAAARAGQQQGAARLVVLRGRHLSSPAWSWIKPRLCPWRGF